MQKQKAMIIIACLLLVCFLFYLFFSNFNQSEQVSLKIQASNITEQTDHDTAADKDPIENSPNHPAAKEEEQQEADVGDQPKLEVAEEEDEEQEPLTITEEFKEKVREVVEGAINLFKKDIKIVAVGDSLTQGVGDETESGGYVGILNHTFEDNNLNVTIENYGKRGNRTDQLLKRLENEEIASSIKKADVVLITIGANDLMKVLRNNITNLTVEPFQQERLEYVKRLTAIFNKINEQNPDAQIYLIGFYNPFERHFGEIQELGMIMNNWNDAGKSVTEEFGNVHYIPTADLFTNSDIELLADDYFHPNTSGYKLIAKRVLENMKEIIVEY